MAEKSKLQSIRDTLKKYDKKFSEALSYYAGPELTKLGQGIAAFLPFQNLPNMADLVRKDRSAMENIGKFSSDLAITGAELFPPTLFASKLATTPAKVADDVVFKTIKKTKSEDATKFVSTLNKNQKQAFDNYANSNKPKDLAVLLNAIFKDKNLAQNSTIRKNLAAALNKGDASFNDIVNKTIKRYKVDEAAIAGWREAGELSHKQSVINMREAWKSKKESAISKSVATKKIQKIDEVVGDFTNLKNQMISKGQRLDQALVETAGRKLPKGTKHYQVITKFETYADDIKKKDKDLYEFIKQKVDNYKAKEHIITDPTKKLQKGDIFLEETREGVVNTITFKKAKQQLDRAHSVMQKRLIKYKKLVDNGFISPEDYEKLRRPQYLLLNADNLRHVELENSLDNLLETKFYLKNKGKPLEKINSQIEKHARGMEHFGAESTLWDPSDMKLKTFGRKITPEEIIERVEIRDVRERLQEGATSLNQGGLVGINHLTRPI